MISQRKKKKIVLYSVFWFYFDKGLYYIRKNGGISFEWRWKKISFFQFRNLKRHAIFRNIRLREMMKTNVSDYTRGFLKLLSVFLDKFGLVLGKIMTLLEKICAFNTFVAFNFPACYSIKTIIYSSQFGFYLSSGNQGLMSRKQDYSVFL